MHHNNYYRRISRYNVTPEDGMESFEMKARSPWSRCVRVGYKQKRNEKRKVVAPVCWRTPLVPPRCTPLPSGSPAVLPPPAQNNTHALYYFYITNLEYFIALVCFLLHNQNTDYLLETCMLFREFYIKRVNSPQGRTNIVKHKIVNIK